MRDAAIAIAAMLVFVSPVIFGSDARADEPGVLRIPMRSLELNLDPQSMTDSYSMMVNVQLYRGLFKYNSDSEIEPDLVESWETSPDHKTYRFKLRSRKFSNDTRITSENVRQTFARIFYIGASMGADLSYVHGVSKFRKSGQIRDLGIHTPSAAEIVFELDSPSPLFLKHLAVPDCGILSIRDFRDALPDNPVSSGPFVLKSRTSLEVVLALRQDESFSPKKGAPKLVRLSKGTDLEAIQWAMKGQLDSLDTTTSLTSHQFNELTAKGWQQTVTDICTQHYVLVNPNQYSKEIRTYLAEKLDREALLGKLNVKGLRPAYGLIPIGLAGSMTNRPSEIQIRRMAQPPLGQIELQYIAGDPFETSIAEELASQWSLGRFKVLLKPLPLAELLKRIGNKTGKVVLGRKGMDYPDGFAMLSYFRTGYEGNHYFAGNQETDRRLDQLAGIYDSRERDKMYREIQIELLGDHTFLPVFFGTRMAGLWSERIEFIPPHPMGLHMLGLEQVVMRELAR